MVRRASHFIDDEPKGSSNRRSLFQAAGGIALMLATGLGGYGAYALGLFNTPPAVDPATGCLVGGPPAKTTIAVIDTTDKLSPLHQERLKSRLKATAASMPDYGRLVVVVLNPKDPTAPQEIFARCAPRSPERTSALEGGSVVVRNEWQRKFAVPLLASVSNLGDTSAVGRSPIMPTIDALTQRPDFDGKAPDRTLVLISDLLEVDPGDYVQRAGMAFMPAYRKSSLATTVHPDLRKVSVVVDYLQRPDQARAQTEAHRAFWRTWLTEAGATQVTFEGVRDDRPADQAAPIELPAPAPKRTTRPKGRRS